MRRHYADFYACTPEEPRNPQIMLQQLFFCQIMELHMRSFPKLRCTVSHYAVSPFSAYRLALGEIVQQSSFRWLQRRGGSNHYHIDGKRESIQQQLEVM